MQDSSPRIPSLLHVPARFEVLPEYCPECRAHVPHSKHRRESVPEGGMPPRGQYAPEHQPDREAS